MKLYRFVLFLMLGLNFGTMLSSEIQAEDYVLDPKTSRLYWFGRKPAGRHHGSVPIQKGRMSGLEKCKGRIVVDLRKLEVLDLKHGFYKDKLTRHLKSKDFFHVRRHPLAVLEILSCSKDRNAYLLNGRMTIRGKTRPVSFRSAIQIRDRAFLARGRLTLDRTRWGLQHRSGSYFKGLADQLIDDKFDLVFEIRGHRAH